MVTNRRRIVRRTRGSRHGPITRLMSPSDLGQELKPFVFLDLFDLKGGRGGTDLHPHSGIATVTYLFEGSIRYEDSNGATGVLSADGVEWVQSRSRRMARRGSGRQPSLSWLPALVSTRAGAGTRVSRERISGAKQGCPRRSSASPDWNASGGDESAQCRGVS